MRFLHTDLKYALRTYRRSPGFAAAAIATLALGIGATAAVFSVVHGVVLAPLPFEDPSRLVVVWETDPHNQAFEEAASFLDLQDWKREQKSFTAIAGRMRQLLNLSESGGEPERLRASAVTHEFFGLLGVSPAMGRVPRPDEDQPGAPGVLVISDGLWRERFGAAENVLGKTVALDGKPHQIIGVMPPGFDFPWDSRAWVPLEPALSDHFRRERGTHPIIVFGRLKPGVTAAQADAEMSALMERLAKAYPDENAGRGARVQPLHEAIVGEVRRPLAILLGAVAFVTLIACANVSGLLLARAAGRSREMAVRRALGAGRGRLIAQLLTESVLLALVGGLAGLAIASWGVDALLALAPRGLPRVGAVHVSLPVVAFVMAASAFAGFLAGIAPALTASRDLRGALAASDSRGGSRQGVRSALVVAQVALAVVLASGAALLLRSLDNLLRVNPGFRTAGLLTAEVSLPRSKYPEPKRDNMYDWPQVQRFYAELMPRLETLPGAVSASFAINHPLRPGWTSQIEIPGRAQSLGERDEVRIRAIAPGYFETIGARIVAGRAIEARDHQDAEHVVAINEAFARKYFPNEDPVGKTVAFWSRPRRIVGVAADVRFQGLAAEPDAAVYPSLYQVPMSGITIVARSETDATAIAPALRAAVKAVDPDVAVYDVRSAEELLAESLGGRRFQTTLLSIFGASALLLSAIGLYGLLAYSVARRRREMGIRAALGAGRSDIVGLVVREGLFRALPGVAIGVVGAIAATRLLASTLFGISPTDTVTFAGVAVALVAACLLASYLPARRAASVEPATALRTE
jgi:putative ABC transport system permease protein